MEDRFFSPSFGNKPQVLVGRSNELRELTEGLDSKPGSKERARLIIGQRGLGKTVLMLEVADYAKSHGYIVASPTIAKKGMEQKIIEKLLSSGNNILEHSRRRISGGAFGALGFSVGIETEKPSKESGSFQAKLSEICDEAAKHGKGVVIMLDEVQNNAYTEEVAVAYQELVGEEKNIAMIMAGLPATISGVLNNRVLTFLTRSSKLYLEPINYTEIDTYYYKCFREMGITLSEEQIMDAAVQTEGSPYLMQLIGHYITVLADNDGFMDDTLYSRAISTAKKEYMNDLCEVALHGISGGDMAFLRAMTDDPGSSKIQHVADRMGVSSAYAQTYKKRMMEAGLIEKVSRGEIRFAVPMLREYLVSHGA